VTLSRGINANAKVTATAGLTAVAAASRTSQEFNSVSSMPQQVTALDGSHHHHHHHGNDPTAPAIDHYASSSFEAALNQVLALERDSPTKSNHQPSFETAVRDFFRV
jgi:hypothetical protein